jgi:hypothetical protein
MSSESNDRKPETLGAAPASHPSKRASARVPSAWGAARDALAAVHNLEALLRSERVSTRTIRDLVPELRGGAGVLRTAFAQARTLGGAGVAVAEHGCERVAGLERLLDAAAAASQARVELAARAHALEEELEATADLLALLDRAAAPSATEVSVDLIVREAGRIWGSGRGRVLAVRFDEASPDGVVMTDPYVVGPLLALLVAWVRAFGVEGVAVRARCGPPKATFVVEEAGAPDGALPVIEMRVMPSIPPTEQVARRVAEQIGAVLEMRGQRGSIALPLAAG